MSDGLDRPRASLVREIPVDERPRERLLATSGAALSDAELLSILVRSGRKGHSSIDLARELLARHGSIDALSGASVEALLLPGIGPAKAATLMAALEIARRVARGCVPAGEPMTHAAAVARYLLLRYGIPDQEVMGVIHLDTRNRHLADQVLFRGSLSRAAVEPRQILKSALLRSAASIVLFHTHPSGDPSPSPEDLAFTRRLAEAGEAVGVRLVDHLVIGALGRWLSLKERGSL